MKKWLVLLLALAMVLAFAACGEKPADTPPADTPPADAPADTPADTPDTPAGPDWSTLKVGVFQNSTGSDGGWGSAIYESVQQFIAEHDLREDQVIWIESIIAGTEDVDNIIAELVDEGCQIIIAHSGGYTSQFAAAAAKYPDVYFAGFECAVTSDNAMMYSISDYQSEFLCGYAAALMSEGNELGFVGTMPTTTICRLANAFAMGAKYANPDATVQVIFTSSWYDPATEKEAATTLLNKGITVLGYSGSNSSVATACTEFGGDVYCTGNYVDMHDYGPSVVLTSHLINWVAMLNDVCTKVLEGTWDGETVIYTMADGAAKISPANPDIVPADVAAQLQEVTEAMTAGDIEVFAGPLSDNEGNELAPEGGSLSGTDLLSVTYLVENVIGTLP